ncbi:MAG TPA: hypothetical protein VFE55_10220 [Acidimicrobiia bacterium]|nr:hypothetical protein [Acidimicrobiia bacterium]
MGVVGLVAVQPAQGRAAGPAPGGGAAVLDLPVPARPAPTTTTTAPPETTTTTAPPETTTTTAPAPSAPSTNAPLQPPAPPPPPPAPARPPVVSSGPQAEAEVEAIADSSGWNWRTAGVRFNLAFYPADCCHWGVYESAKSVIWIGPTAFDDPTRLRYVVLHELAHAWQYRQNRFAQFITDYTPWGFTTIGPALEAGADCLANVWGAAGGHYWACPPAARALAGRRYAGDWS